jgi:hypothetical protein
MTFGQIVAGTRQPLYGKQSYGSPNPYIAVPKGGTFAGSCHLDKVFVMLEFG